MTEKSLIEGLQPGDVAVIGVPLDKNSSFRRGPALAPAHIRERLHCGSANLSAENGFNLADSTRWRDVGDVVFNPGEPESAAIETAIHGIVARGARPLSLGGDHSVTYPIVRAVARQHPGLTILHIDAHPDLYDELDGSRHSHACPFARILEEGLAARLVQVGIRTVNPAQRAQIQRFGVETIEMKDWSFERLPRLDGPLYLSLDLDALDPAFVPGVSHHEPGGLSTREVLRVVQSISAPIVGADIVELNPLADINAMTAMVAAKFLKEIAARMLSGVAHPSTSV
jgi:agmatinase